MVEPVTVITATATAIATLIGKKAVEKLGESLGSEVSQKIGEIVRTVRAKFKKIGMEGVLTQVETNPTQPNRQFFQQALEMQMGADTEFAETLIRFKEQLEAMEGGRQIMLSGATLEEVEVGDMKQKGASHQEMLKDASLKKSKLGNSSQE